MFNITVNGAAKENRMLFRLGPIFWRAINNNVSPKNTPIIPDNKIANKNSWFIVPQVSK